MVRGLEGNRRRCWVLRGALAAVTLWVGVGAAEAVETAGQLVMASGPVEVRPGGQGVWRVATLKAVLNPGDMIRTGPGGAAEVAFVHGVFRMAENTVVVLPAPQAMPAASNGSQPLRVLLQGGRALFHILKERLQGPFEVVTPSVIVGVKGTIFGVEQGPNLGVIVFDGAVMVSQVGRPDRAAVRVSAGQFTVLHRGILTPSVPYGRDGRRPIWNGAATRVNARPLEAPPAPRRAPGPQAAAAPPAAGEGNADASAPDPGRREGEPASSPRGTAGPVSLRSEAPSTPSGGAPGAGGIAAPTPSAAASLAPAAPPTPGAGNPSPLDNAAVSGPSRGAAAPALAAGAPPGLGGAAPPGLATGAAPGLGAGSPAANAGAGSPARLGVPPGQGFAAGGTNAILPPGALPSLKDKAGKK